jgi:hypothetical protein
MPHQEKEVSSIVAGRAAAEETGASMLGESQKLIHDLIYSHDEGSFFRQQASSPAH